MNGTIKLPIRMSFDAMSSSVGLQLSLVSLLVVVIVHPTTAMALMTFGVFGSCVFTGLTMGKIDRVLWDNEQSLERMRHKPDCSYWLVDAGAMLTVFASMISIFTYWQGFTSLPPNQVPLKLAGAHLALLAIGFTEAALRATYAKLVDICIRL